MFRALVGAFLTLLVSMQAFAQIAPECAGAQLPAGYDGERHKAFLQNYVAALTHPTPMGALFSRKPQKIHVGLELGFMPPHSCAKRLVKVDDIVKTENTNHTLVLPRIRVQMAFPDWGRSRGFLGVAILPPIATPLGNFGTLSAEIGFGYSSSVGLDFGLRGHLTMAHVVAEIATPFSRGEAVVEDDLYFQTLGGDVNLSYVFNPKYISALTPYLATGMVTTQTIFIVGDDDRVERNQQFPYLGVTSSLGMEVSFCDYLCGVVVEGSAAWGLSYTGKVALILSF